jgi:TolB-like protein/Flp pilus assembly protein TadD
MAVREQLERVLASATFQQAERLKRFLRFIVEESIENRGSELKEYVVAVQVFEKEDSFDPRTDPLVRVQARRLRARLTQYYREYGQHDALIIDLPKGGYAPAFKARERAALQKRSVDTVLLAANTIAVQPFADCSADGSLQYFCDGLREEILHQLAGVERLRVIAGDAADVAGREAYRSAAVLVSGSVRSAADTLRVTAHLVDGGSGCYLWSHSIDGPLVNALAIQEQVAHVIAARLPALTASKGGRGTQNLAAHNLYRQGRYHLDQRTEDGLRKALEFFERSLDEDTRHAAAMSGLSDAYSLLTHYGVRPPADVWARAASAATTAVMLDDTSAEAHTSLAHAKSTQDWDWAGAEREFQRAVALDPRYATAHHWYAMSCLVPMGRLDDALEHIVVAQSLDPVSSIIAREVSLIHYYRRDFEAALEQCDHVVELNPHFAPAYWALGFIQELRREPDESIAAFQRAVQLSPESPRMQAALGRALAISGRRPLASKVLRTLNELASHRYVSPADVALVHFALGQTDVGFEWLDRARAERSFEMLAIKVDPKWDPLRADPRFVEIVARVGQA